nr:carboxylesterase family protein [Cryobacterium sp. PAMC25264]
MFRPLSENAVAPSPSSTRSWPAELHVTGGLVRGSRPVAGVQTWRGIPYAAPPVGALRFRAPEPVIPWRGVRDASRYGLVAAQDRGTQFKGVDRRTRMGEDCLTLNVQRPTDRPEADNLPVMVYIHGGGYTSGSSNDFTERSQAIVRSGGAIYVAINYRLGALGYLDFSRFSTRSRLFESNLGLRDQVAALEWVQENIRAFGGDPRKVTVIGESAGGNAVVTLLATPAADGLFAQAIAQSPRRTPPTHARWPAVGPSISSRRCAKAGRPSWPAGGARPVNFSTPRPGRNWCGPPWSCSGTRRMSTPARSVWPPSWTGISCPNAPWTPSGGGTPTRCP